MVIKGLAGSWEDELQIRKVRCDRLSMSITLRRLTQRPGNALADLDVLVCGHCQWWV